MRAHIASLVSSRGSSVGKGGRKLITEKVGCTESDSDPSELMRPALVSLRTWHSCPLSNAVPSFLLALSATASFEKHLHLLRLSFS